MPTPRRSARQAAATVATAALVARDDQQVRNGDRVLVVARAFNGIEVDSDLVRSAYAGQQVYTEEQLIGTAVWESRTHVGVKFDVDGARSCPRDRHHASMGCRSCCINWFTRQCHYTGCAY